MGKSPVVPDVATAPTFEVVLERYLILRGQEWSHKKHATQWPSSLNTYAKPLVRMPVDTIASGHVADCLIPTCQAKQEQPQEQDSAMSGFYREPLQWANARAQIQQYRPIFLN